MPGQCRVETRSATPFRDLGIGKTEPPVCMLLAQKFQRVRREIHEDQDAVWPQHSPGFSDRVGGTVGVVQHLVDYDGIERSVRQGQLIHVTKANRPVLETGPLEVDACHGQHLAGLIDTECVLYARRQNFEHATGSGADIEEIARIGRGDDLDERRLDLALIDVKRADAVPPVGIFAEIGAGSSTRLRLR